MTRRLRIQRTYEYFTDLIATVVSNLLSILICTKIERLPMYQTRQGAIFVFIAFLCYTLIFLSFSNPLNLSKRSRSMEFFSILRNNMMTYGLIVVALMMMQSSMIIGRLFITISFVINIILSSIFRYTLKRVLLVRFSNTKRATLSGVVTVSERADTIIQRLDSNWIRKIKGVALLDAVEEDGVFKHYHYSKYKDGNYVKDGNELEVVREIEGVPVKANKDGIIEWAKRSSLDEMFIILPRKAHELIDVTKLVDELESMGIEVHINIPSIEEAIDSSEFNNIKCDIIAGYPVATLVASTPIPAHLAIAKRIIDIIGSLIGIIISIPIIAITAIPLKLESEGPLFFKQERVGRNGRTFYMYKLRSMYKDAEERKAELMKENKMDGLMFKMDNDPRITKVGKFIRKTSIDELPQFFNVFKGDMSLVGTRPPTVKEFEQYESHHKRRLSLRPGITGLWQVSGRSNILDFEEIVKMDVEYIDNWSPWLDTKIFIKTVWVVLTHKGAE